MDDESLEMELNKYITLDGQIAPEIVSGIHSPSLHLRLESVKKVGQLLRSKTRSADATVRSVVDSGLLPNIIDILSSSDPALVSEASWIILNVTLGTSQQTSAAVSEGAIPQLLQVAASASNVEDVRHNALLSLGNIAGDSDALRDVFLEKRAFRPALDILADPSKFSPKTVKTAAWIMETCTAPGARWRHYDVSTFNEAIPILCEFIQQRHKSKPLAAVVKAIRRICSSQKAANMIFEAGACPRLVHFCASKNDGLREDALNVVSRFAFEEGRLLQSIFDNGVLQALHTCITDRVESRQLACFVASNIAMAAPPQAEPLVESSILPLLIEMVADEEEEAGVRREAATVLQHLVRRGEKTHDYYSSLVEADCVEACSAALQSQDGPTVEKAVRIIAYLIDTPWSGADDAIERLEDSAGVNLLRRVWLEWKGPRVNSSVTAHALLRAYFPEASKHPRV
ncbi:Importin alpha subunit (Karyopherin alpha subunit) (Serine-rich RNA polymerase I suppressor protein) [Tulasnella sp. UAMH 9824]|nr:Importin alpha subunit (Karyopherin alpha subunit) (Serine-rich RNA polymerase I suppressor protein) [Tulasnella sp. UAMH 9824]